MDIPWWFIALGLLVIAALGFAFALSGPVKQDDDLSGVDFSRYKDREK